MVKGYDPGPGDLNSCLDMETNQLSDLGKTFYLCAPLFNLKKMDKWTRRFLYMWPLLHLTFYDYCLFSQCS